MAYSYDAIQEARKYWSKKISDSLSIVIVIILWWSVVPDD